MLSHNKKAAGLSMIFTIIFVLISFGMLISLQQGLFSSAKKITEGDSCKFALGLEKLSDKTVFTSFKNNCKTIIVDIPQKRYTAKSNSDISKEIARKITRTWDIVHKGTIENMWTADKGIMTSVMGSEKGCLIMYIINLNYVPQKDYYTQEQLYGFMAESKHTKPIDGVLYSYLDYLQFSGAKGALQFPEVYTPKTSKGTKYFSWDTTNENYKIKQGEEYAISIISPANEIWKDWLDVKGKPTIITFSTVKYAENNMGCIAK